MQCTTLLLELPINFQCGSKCLLGKEIKTVIKLAGSVYSQSVIFANGVFLFI